MDIPDHIDAQQAGVNHCLEVVRHARLRPSETESATGQVLLSGQHTHKLQAHRIA